MEAPITYCGSPVKIPLGLGQIVDTENLGILLNGELDK